MMLKMKNKRITVRFNFDCGTELKHSLGGYILCHIIKLRTKYICQGAVFVKGGDLNRSNVRRFIFHIVN